MQNFLILNYQNRLQSWRGLPQAIEEPQAGHVVSTTSTQSPPPTYARPWEHLPRQQHHRKQPCREANSTSGILRRLAC
jgi:hypothetical protein